MAQARDAFPDPAEKEIESYKALNSWLHDLPKEGAVRKSKWGSRLVVQGDHLEYHSGLLAIIRHAKPNLQDIAEFCDTHRIVLPGLAKKMREHNKTAKKDQKIEPRLLKSIEHLENIQKNIFNIIERKDNFKGTQKLTEDELSSLEHLRNHEGRTVFSEAILQGHTEIIRQLISRYPHRFKKELSAIVERAVLMPFNDDLCQRLLPTALRFGDSKILDKLVNSQEQLLTDKYRITLDCIRALMDAPQENLKDLTTVLQVKTVPSFRLDMMKIFDELLILPLDVALLTFLQRNAFLETRNHTLLEHVYVDGLEHPQYRAHAGKIVDILIKDCIDQAIKTQEPSHVHVILHCHLGIKSANKLVDLFIDAIQKSPDTHIEPFITFQTVSTMYAEMKTLFLQKQPPVPHVELLRLAFALSGKETESIRAGILKKAFSVTMVDLLRFIPMHAFPQIMRLYDSFKQTVHINDDHKLRMAVLFGYNIPMVSTISQEALRKKIGEYFLNGTFIEEERAQIGPVQHPKYAVVFNREIGRGGFKIAQTAIKIITEHGQNIRMEEMAHLKTIRPITTQHEYDAAVKEIEIGELLKDIPHIARSTIYGALNQGKAIRIDEPFTQGVAYELSLVSPICNGNLWDLIDRDRQQGRLYDLDTVIKRLEVVRDAFRALVGAHKKGVMHADIKPGNILIPLSGGNGALSDFGLAIRNNYPSDQPNRKHYGTPKYGAPEFQQNKPRLLTFKDDVFAMANTIKEVFDGEVFSFCTKAKESNLKYNDIQQALTPILQQSLPNPDEYEQARLDLYNYLYGLLVPASRRPGAEEALKDFEKMLDGIIDRRTKALKPK